ncbi:DNA-directed RNA polymerase subunit E'' [Candidatus Woesearchaeota archaeon]|nr:DNA-directed RNA polymerase subunit E'' [Candidatus Woesearchaeota archaeon]
MAKREACKTCNLLLDDSGACPICKKRSASPNWTGRINVIDAAKSTIAQKMNLTVKGEYAIKVK